MPLPLEVPEYCPKMLIEPSRFLNVWAMAE
jgi:hypothetical protein